MTRLRHVVLSLVFAGAASGCRCESEEASPAKTTEQPGDPKALAHALGKARKWDEKKLPPCTHDGMQAAIEKDCAATRSHQARVTKAEADGADAVKIVLAAGDLAHFGANAWEAIQDHAVTTLLDAGPEHHEEEEPEEHDPHAGHSHQHMPKIDTSPWSKLMRPYFRASRAGLERIDAYLRFGTPRERGAAADQLIRYIEQHPKSVGARKMASRAARAESDAKRRARLESVGRTLKKP